jgi:hypothetical protein
MRLEELALARHEGAGAASHDHADERRSVRNHSRVEVVERDENATASGADRLV